MIMSIEYFEIMGDAMDECREELAQAEIDSEYTEWAAEFGVGSAPSEEEMIAMAIAYGEC